MHYYYDEEEKTPFYQITKEGDYNIITMNNTVVLKRRTCDEIIQYDSVLVINHKHGKDIFFPYRTAEFEYDEEKGVRCGFKNIKSCQYFKHPTRVNYGLLLIQCSDNEYIATVPDYIDWQYPVESIESRLSRLPKFHINSTETIDLIKFIDEYYIHSFLLQVGTTYQLVKIGFLTGDRDYINEHYIEINSKGFEKVEDIPNIKYMFKSIEIGSEKFCDVTGQTLFGPFYKIVPMKKEEYPGTYKYFHEYYSGFWGINSDGKIEAFTLVDNQSQKVGEPYPYTIYLDSPAEKMVFLKRKQWQFNKNSKKYCDGRFIDIWKIYRGDSYKLLFQVINNIKSTSFTHFSFEFELDEAELMFSKI